MAAGSKNNPQNRGKGGEAITETVLVCTPTKNGLGLRKTFVQRTKGGK